jgi:drug/metabolite transporter (DMT)-like permease
VARPQVTARVWIALATVYVVWGSTYLGIEVAIRTIPPFLMCAVRFLIAGAILYAFTARGQRLTARHWLSAFLIGAPLLLVGNAAVAWSEQYIDTGLAALLVSSMPLWLALLDRVFYGQRLAWMAIAGLAVGFGGVALLVGPGGGDWHGVVLVFSSLAWAAGSLYSRRAPLPPRPLVGAAMQMLAGGLMLTVLSAATGELGRFHPSQVSWQSGLGLVYLVVVGSLIGFTSYIWLLRSAPTSLVGTYAYVNPVVAVLLGVLWLSESLSWPTLVGGLVIVGSVALIVRAPRHAARVVEPRPAAVPARGS